MPKERSFNPAAEQRKADKRKEIAKNKKQVQSQRDEKLARRNPERIQRQIDELKELESRGALRPKDQETLKQLERDVKGIKRAREALGDAAPTFPERRDARQEQRQRRQDLNKPQHLGKRRRDEEDAQSSDTDPEVRDIPMPKGTPPPIPRQQREHRQDGRDTTHPLPPRPAPPPPAQTVYSSAPQIRDLKKEAVKFMPAAVSAHKKRMKGEGRLLEPEEIDRLEKAGYGAAKAAADEAEKEERYSYAVNQAKSEEVKDMSLDDLDAEARRFEADMRKLEAETEPNGPRPVQVEDVEDDGD